LDEFGAFMISQIDGRRTVTELVDLFEQRYPMSRRECELGVIAFIKMLMKRNVLGVQVPGEEVTPHRRPERPTGSTRASR